MEFDVPVDDDDGVPISVAVRVSPCQHQNQNICVQVNAATNELYLGHDRKFLFDTCYGPDTCQEDVFRSSVEPLVTGPLLDGYNVSVIMYGAANTGKTHTLVGPSLMPLVSEESFGLIPRTARTLFHFISQLPVSQFVVEVEFVEIHNEEIRDLLSDNLANVYIDSDNSLTPVSRVQCSNTSEVLSCLEMGQSIHQQCRNISNITEPASHTSFTISVFQQSVSDAGLNVIKQSKLQFIDLAPSDKMTTGGQTNLGLLTLGNVISALGDPRRKVSMVPYQDSLLTRTVSQALGGNCVTLIICCLSPLISDCEETTNTLMTASTAANIINNPSPNIVTQDMMSPGPQYNNNIMINNPNILTQDPSINMIAGGYHQYNNNIMMSPGQYPPPYLPDRRDSYLSGISPSKTPLSCISPLSYKSSTAPIQLYLPQTEPPVQEPPPLPGNQGHMMMISSPGTLASNLSGPRPASQNLIQDGIVDNEEMFKLQFAASQYKALVSSAGELLKSISLSAEVEEKREIESWICKKEESENVIKKSGAKEKALDKIVEESEDDSEVPTASLTTDASGTVSEDETSDDSEDIDIDERLEIYITKFRQKTDFLVSNAEASYDLLLNGPKTNDVEKPRETTIKHLEPKRLLPINEIKEECETEIVVNVSAEEQEIKNLASNLPNTNCQISDLQEKLDHLKQVILSSTPKSGNVSHLQQQLILLTDQHERLKLRLSNEESLKQKLESKIQEDQDLINSLKHKLEYQQKLLEESWETSRDISAKQEWLKQEEERISCMKKSALELEQSLLERQKLGDESQIQETTFTSANDIELLPLNTCSIREEIEDLRKIRNIFFLERQKLDDKLNEQQCLSTREERKLVELDESVEAIDSAIEYKNEIICNKNVSYTKYKGDDILMKKLVKLNIQETRALLHRYFKRVLDLRMEGKKMEIHLEEVEEQYKDLEKIARDLGRSLQRSKVQSERKLMTQQKEFQSKINVLAEQLAQETLEKHSLEYTRKLKSLEKEVYHYKNLCKELKKSQDSYKHKSASVNPGFIKTEDVGNDTEAGYTSSRPSSVMSHIQPGHIEMFQKRLAKLQKKMGDTAKPTVTREQRKIIIENPVSASNSVEKKSEKSSRRKR